MVFWLVVGTAVAVLAIIYLLKPTRMPTVDIRKFPRKYPDEKVTFLHHNCFIIINFSQVYTILLVMMLAFLVFIY